MATERTRSMVILAMNVIGERAAERDKACSGSGGGKPSFGDHETQHVRKADTRLGAQNTGFGIKEHETIEAAHIDERTRAIEAGVAVGSPQSDRQFPPGASVADKGRQFAAKARARNALWFARNAAPRQHVGARNKRR